MAEDKTFTLSAEQYKKYNEWREEKNKTKGEVYVGAIGGAYSFCFTPTGLGTMVVVKCADGTELDLTEYEYW
jgi:hypothetical protein